MSNYIEYKDKMTFHPGYYIKEIIEDLGMTQEDFAKRLGTTPKNLSLIVRGEQRLSADMAMKLAKMLGTSMTYWQNLQNAYDAAKEEIISDEELEKEKCVLRDLGYGYFRDNFGLPDLPRDLSSQVEKVRSLLKVSSLCTLANRDFAVSFRSEGDGLNEANIARANAMVQIAVNEALQSEIPAFDKGKFEEAANFALTQTRNHSGFYPLIRDAFRDAGVAFVVLPNLSGSKVNGATKKMGSHVMLMVNDRRLYADSFWFTLFHEIGHIMNGDYGMSFENERGEREERADEYARDALVDPIAYRRFLMSHKTGITCRAIEDFADSIARDPGIVLGRLQNDGYVGHNDSRMKPLKRQYVVAPF